MRLGEGATNLDLMKQEVGPRIMSAQILCTDDLTLQARFSPMST